MENTKNDKMSHKVGDAIERVGEKVSDMGAQKIGNRITNAGDRIEHSEDSAAVKPAEKDL